MASVMNKELQMKIISDLLKKNGIEPDTVDLLSEVDETLTLGENIDNLSKKLGVPLSKELQERKMIDEEMIEYMNNLMLEEELKEIEDEEVEEEMEETTATEEIEELKKIEEEIEEYEDEIDRLMGNLVNKVDPLEFFSKYMFPEIIGEQYNDVRKAALLMLASQRDLRKRTRIHILLVGPPGCGKTEILLWMQRKLRAYFINAEYASKIGLAGDARGKEVTPGALAEAHGGIIAIDELDKMSIKDQSALLQAMEEGQYTIIKGKHREKFKAEVRVIATANDIDRIQKPLRDRFDFIFELKPPNREERAENASALIEQFFGEYELPKEQVFYEYLSWIQNFEPKPENIEIMKKVMRSYLNLTNKDISEASYRSLELSILRIAYALAKLKRSNITPVHLVQAIQLKDSTLTHEQIRYLMSIAKGLV